ncbi:MAG: aldehyde ferredoxin oxidoreductase family protein [Candidatus Helarchaeota archaeon]
MDYKLLRVNLKTRQTHVEEISFNLLKKYIGGKGLGTKYLYDELRPKIDPLGPKNKLIFVAGPLTATFFPTSNRYGILYKSPLTGTYAESYSGGGAAQKMRAAGYFVVIIEDISDERIYLHLTPDEIYFKDASTIWGKDTLETYNLLKRKTRSDLDIMCIGPAGENLVRIANVQNNRYHSAGRCGPGAVMGSKKLKAIVFSGTLKPSLSKKPGFKELVKKILARIHANSQEFGSEGIYKKLGTPSIVDWANALGCFPTRYFTKGYSEYSKNFNANALLNKILKNRVGCWNCPFTCGKYVEVNEEPFQCALEGPEYETIAAFGGMCDVRDIVPIAKLNEYCDRAGIDTISAGSLCGLAIEAKRRKRLSNLDDIRIDYNEPIEILKFLKMLVEMEGIGADFAMGTKFVSAKYQLTDIAMHVKGLDFAGYDPRAFRGFTTSYGVSPEGPTHLRSTFHGIEKDLPDYLSYENKVAPMIEEEDRMAIIDSLIVCKFIRSILDWEILVEIYTKIFDTEVTKDELRALTGNTITLSRKFNVREGFSRKDDYMPERVYREKIQTKDGKVLDLDREKYEKLLDEYYELRGWSPNGIP